jgi:DNA-directed RNA polymerase III subunit RPC1
MTGIHGSVHIETDKSVTPNQYIIYASGINMYDIRKLKYIDLSRTRCNDIVKIAETFGIEAARTLLVHELMENLSNNDNIVYQHFSVLADLMTRSGHLISIDRHGVSRQEIDILARASFEKPIDILLSGAVFGETDYMHSTSSRIMAGLECTMGTGLCRLHIDTNLIVNSEVTDHEFDTRDISNLTLDSVIQSILDKEIDPILSANTFYPM